MNKLTICYFMSLGMAIGGIYDLSFGEIKSGILLFGFGLYLMNVLAIFSLQKQINNFEGAKE